MMRITVSIFCFLLLLPQPALRAQAVRPLGEILLDLGRSSEARARKIAEKQAVQRWKMDKGPLYKSCPAMVNRNGNVVSDEKIFEGDFTPESNKTKLAIFSDDGCDVWVDGVRILHNFKKPQHLPNLAHSFHVLENYKPQAGKPNHIKIHYSNTIFLGKTDIDGCTLFGYENEGEKPLKPENVDFANKSRMGDKVVVANDDVGNVKVKGEKTLEVTVAPKNAQIELRIKRARGNAGSSVFKDTGTEKTQVTGGDKPTIITIVGGKTSDEPRNMEIQYELNAKNQVGFVFTVFRVEMIPFVEGKSADIISPDAKNRVNLPLTDFTTESFGYSEKNGNINGSIYHLGRIWPPIKGAKDFEKDFDTEIVIGFNGTRDKFFRLYIDNCLPEAVPLPAQNPTLPSAFIYGDNEIDNRTDNNKDNTPGVDRIPDKASQKIPHFNVADPHLYLHTTDVIRQDIDFLIKKNVLKNGQNIKLRFKADEFFTYGGLPADAIPNQVDVGVLCSNKSRWYFAFSGTNRNGVYTAIEDKKGIDNKVGLKDIDLTPDFSNVPKGKGPVLSKLEEPANGKVDLPPIERKTVKIVIVGKNLADQKCMTRAVFQKYAFFPESASTLTRRIDLKINEISADGTKITGSIELNFPALTEKGKYTLRVFVDSHPSAELIDVLSIE